MSVAEICCCKWQRSEVPATAQLPLNQCHYDSVTAVRLRCIISGGLMCDSSVNRWKKQKPSTLSPPSKANILVATHACNLLCLLKYHLYIDRQPTHQAQRRRKCGRISAVPLHTNRLDRVQSPALLALTRHSSTAHTDQPPKLATATPCMFARK